MVKIKVWSTNVDVLNDFTGRIVDIAKKTGVKLSGPIPLPTKRLSIRTLKLPHGEGKKKYEKWEMRIHKRLLYIAADERVMKQLIRLRVPPEIWMEIEL
ncbi:30S ribosomal protein S10P [Thermogladius calderae 1633]|uniref:Small ribosomal subunit protein uS10 n=2 Tax=Desulfurococcaceae TaxID=2272 RepID=I3TDW3_THEC1|nr:30S ribosomal protein S10P [Thermogladius calderae 1633]